MHALGFRDCALEALRYLTDRGRLDPQSAVVQGIRGLLDRPTGAACEPPLTAGSAADVDVCSDVGNVRRVRRTTSRSSEDRENRSLTARRCLYGRVNRRQSHRSRPRYQHVPTATIADPTLTSLSLSDCGAVRNRVGRSTAVVGEEGQRHYPLGSLQAAAVLVPCCSSTSPVTGGVHLRRDVDEARTTTLIDVVDCASVLINLARTDTRVHSILAELLELIDAE